MCLSTVSLNLAYKRGEFIGEGYKRIYSEDQKSDYPIGKWLKAQGRKFENAGLSLTIPADDMTMYHPGFHIFLKEEDANKYNNCISGDTYLVQFKNVISFGTNEVGYEKPSYDLIYGPCVVAQYMRLVKQVA